MKIKLESKRGDHYVVRNLPTLPASDRNKTVTIDQVDSYTYEYGNESEVIARVSAHTPDGTQFTTRVYMSKGIIVLFSVQGDHLLDTIKQLKQSLLKVSDQTSVSQVYDTNASFLGGIYAVVLDPVQEYPFDPLMQIAAQERSVRAEEVKWVVNEYNEIGVEIRGRSFFMYKGRSLEYEERIRTRPLGKREAGETLRVKENPEST